MTRRLNPNLIAKIGFAVVVATKAGRLTNNYSQCTSNVNPVVPYHQGLRTTRRK